MIRGGGVLWRTKSPCQATATTTPKALRDFPPSTIQAIQYHPVSSNISQSHPTPHFDISDDSWMVVHDFQWFVRNDVWLTSKCSNILAQSYDGQWFGRNDVWLTFQRSKNLAQSYGGLGPGIGRPHKNCKQNESPAWKLPGRGLAEQMLYLAVPAHEDIVIYLHWVCF